MAEINEIVLHTGDNDSTECPRLPVPPQQLAIVLFSKDLVLLNEFNNYSLSDLQKLKESLLDYIAIDEGIHMQVFSEHDECL